MRAFDRDLIRGGHYGQRSCEPHSKAEHMAAPTNAAALVTKVLANSEPSTHGPSRHFAGLRNLVAIGAQLTWPNLLLARSRSLMTQSGLSQPSFSFPLRPVERSTRLIRLR